MAKIALRYANSIYLVDTAVIRIKHGISLSKQELGDSKHVVRFIEGKKILKGSMHMQFQDPSTISLPYFDTSEDGILHSFQDGLNKKLLKTLRIVLKLEE